MHYTVNDPEVVNGLQTSTLIYHYLKSTGGANENRNVLVRFIQVTDAGIRDRIIKATNNQTSIPQSSFYATDEVQRNIEIFLPSVGLYYDRRKAHYRNKGIPVAKIVTIGYLTQALVAIVLQQPDDSRARPSTVTAQHYSEVFNNEYPPLLYGKCALLMKRVDAYLRTIGTLDAGEQSNVRFYLAMYASCVALKSSKPNRNQISGLELADVTDGLLKECLDIVVDHYKHFGGNDKAAKGPGLASELREMLKAKLGHPTPNG